MISYYTGTGNSRYCAELLAREGVAEDYLTVARDYEKTVLAGRN